MQTNIKSYAYCNLTKSGGLLKKYGISYPEYRKLLTDIGFKSESAIDKIVSGHYKITYEDLEVMANELTKLIRKKLKYADIKITPEDIDSSFKVTLNIEAEKAFNNKFDNFENSIFVDFKKWAYDELKNISLLDAYKLVYYFGEYEEIDINTYEFVKCFLCLTQEGKCLIRKTILETTVSDLLSNLNQIENLLRMQGLIRCNLVNEIVKENLDKIKSQKTTNENNLIDKIWEELSYELDRFYNYIKFDEISGYNDAIENFNKNIYFATKENTIEDIEMWDIIIAYKLVQSSDSFLGEAENKLLNSVQDLLNQKEYRVISDDEYEEYLNTKESYNELLPQPMIGAREVLENMRKNAPQ